MRLSGKIRVLMLLVLSVVMIVVAVGCSKDEGTVIIGSKKITESEILAEAYKLLIEKNTDLKVERKTGLVNNVIWESIKNKDIDMYVEYTGSGLFNILKQPAEYDPQEVYNKVSKAFKEQFNIVWFDPIGFNNTYALTLRQEDVDRLKLTKTSDLQSVASELSFGSTDDFIKREDGLPLVQKTYDLGFKEVRTVDVSIKVRALVEKSVDVIDGFTTDPQLLANNLVTLEDDKHVFVPYYAAPIIREEKLEKYPELKEVLNKLSGKINDETIRKLNGEVELNHKSPTEVAKEWLTAEKLL